MLNSRLQKIIGIAEFCGLWGLTAANFYQGIKDAVHTSLKLTLEYKPRILGPKIGEFPYLVHWLSVIYTVFPHKRPSLE